MHTSATQAWVFRPEGKDSDDDIKLLYYPPEYPESENQHFNVEIYENYCNGTQ